MFFYAIIRYSLTSTASKLVDLIWYTENSSVEDEILWKMAVFLKSTFPKYASTSYRDVQILPLLVHYVVLNNQQLPWKQP